MKTNIIRPFILVASIASMAFLNAANPVDKEAAKKPADAPAAAPATDAVLATVDGQSITQSEVDAAIGQVLAQRGMPANAIPPQQRDMITRSMLDDLVVDKLVTKACVDVKVSDAEVDEEFAKIKKSFGGSDEDLAKQIEQAGLTLPKLKADIRERTQKSKWLDAQIKGKFEVPSDADAKDFYDKNPQHFEQPEMVRASHILFRLDEKATPAQVSEAMKKAEAATVRAKKEDFAALAGELSEEPGAKERGGDLNFFPRTGAMVEPFAEAAYKLKKDEVTAEPVRTQFGYHVIKVTDRKDASKQPFDASKEKIVEFLGREKKGAAIRGVLDELRKNAKVDIKLPPPTPPQTEAAPASVATPPVAAPTPQKAARKPIEAVTPPVSVPAEPAPKK